MQRKDHLFVKTPNLFRRKLSPQLGEKYNGTRKDFDLSFDIDGTEFQKQVWEQLNRIPYGKSVLIEILRRS